MSEIKLVIAVLSADQVRWYVVFHFRVDALVIRWGIVKRVQRYVGVVMCISWVYVSVACVVLHYVLRQASIYIVNPSDRQLSTPNVFQPKY